MAGRVIAADRCVPLQVTLLAGYAAVIEFAKTATQSTQALHFIPVGLEAVVTPTPLVDIGARFFLDGYVAQTGGDDTGNPNYFDLRTLLLWIRIQV